MGKAIVFIILSDMKYRAFRRRDIVSASRCIPKLDRGFSETSLSLSLSLSLPLSSADASPPLSAKEVMIKGYTLDDTDIFATHYSRKQI